MDMLTDEVRQESPWTMFFADDIAAIGVNVVAAVYMQGEQGAGGGNLG